ncbi:unnamed protein product, partial [Mycena citricolor]
MITSCLRECHVKMLCRLESDDEVEYSGTRNSIVHQGKGCRAQDQPGSRKQPLMMCSDSKLFPVTARTPLSIWPAS